MESAMFRCLKCHRVVKQITKSGFVLIYAFLKNDKRKKTSKHIKHIRGY